MLKTNSKQARENIRCYIMDNFDGSNYGLEKPTTFKEVATIILNVFEIEKPYHDVYMIEHKIPKNKVFIEWASGLPSILNTCYYYNRSAVDDLGGILEQTDKEKNRYTETQSELLLTNLIYSELVRGCK